MKILTKEYWTEFEKLTSDGKIQRDGQKFEDLSEEILLLLFKGRKIKFESTQTTHDGNRDFFAFDEKNRLWWAECKNHERTISLTQLAPTIVMAEIYNASFILFFSYSPINKFTKKKLCDYAELNEKYIIFIDDEILENVIFEYSNIILPKYFPAFIKPEAFSYDCKPECFIEITKDPFLNAISDNEIEFSTELKELSVGEIFCYKIYIINHSPNKKYIVRIIIPVEDDYYYFNYLDEKLEIISGNNILLLELDSGVSLLKRIYVKLVKFKADLKLPDIFINICDKDSRNVLEKNFWGTKILCNWTKKSVFIGSQYQDILTEFKLNCLDNRHLSGMLVYGKSGTGKSRILEECCPLLLQKNYHILNFTGWEENSYQNIIKEIVYIAYKLSDNIIIESICDDIIENVTNIETRKIITFLNKFQNNNLDEYELDNYFTIIFEKLLRERYALIFDNLQSFDIKLLQFIIKFIDYGRNNQRFGKSIILLSLNTDLIQDELYSKFIFSFSQLNSIGKKYFITNIITGFNDEKQGLSYLMSIIGINPLKIDMSLFLELLKKCSFKPKYIEEVARFLILNDCIIKDENHAAIKNSIKIYDLLNGIPNDFASLFMQNFKMLCYYHKEIENEILPILSAIVLFQRLPHSLFQQFGLNQKACNILLKSGIIKQENKHLKSDYIFEHDLIELTLLDKIPDLINVIIDRIINHQQLSLLKNYPVQMQMCIISDNFSESTTIIELCNKIQYEKIPIKLSLSFYARLIDKLCSFINVEDDLKKLIVLNLKKFCILVRDCISEKESEILFEKSYDYINNLNLTKRWMIKEKFSFIVHMGENKIHLKKHEKAVDIFKSYLIELEKYHESFPEAYTEIEYAKAYICNRIFLCGKFTSYSLKYKDKLEISQSIAIKYHFHDINMQNKYDEGIANLYFSDKLEYVLSLWKQGNEIYEVNNLSKYTMNYYTKKIQELLISGNTDSLKGIFIDAFNHLENQNELLYYSFFKARFLHYKSIFLLKVNANICQIEECLEEYEQARIILDGENSLDLLMMKAMYSFKIHDINSAVALYEQCYTIAKDTNLNPKKELDFKIVAENIIINCQELFQRESDLDFFRDTAYEKCIRQVYMLSKEDYKRYTNSFCSSALIKSNDLKYGFIF